MQNQMQPKGFRTIVQLILAICYRVSVLNLRLCFSVQILSFGFIQFILLEPIGSKSTFPPILSTLKHDLSRCLLSRMIFFALPTS